MDNAKTKRAREAAALEAKAKALRREEKAFWDEVEERLDEVKARFNLSDKGGTRSRTSAPVDDDEPAVIVDEDF